MNTTKLAKLINVSPDTVRRWTNDYRDYLSPTGAPVKGQTRVLTPHDMAVLAHIAVLRDTGLSHEEVTRRLDDLLAGDWQDLPPSPHEWLDETETVAVAEAAERAREMVTIAALQSELRHTQQALEAAQARAESLQGELDALRAQQDASQETIHGLEIEVERAKGEVETLKARLAAYSFGRDHPVNVGFILVAALIAGAVLVALAFVLARVLM
jgi:DNA-binding transcriptional MerR regulator